MSIRALSIAITFLFVGSDVSADGCKFALSGRFVPEREQRAMIEWSDGVETLYVAALSDITSESSIWIVPVRAGGADVRAEPVDDFPVVGYYESVKSRAREQIKNWITFTAFANSGGLCCPLAGGGCSDGRSAAAKEESRVEKLGMIVTVVSASSQNALAQYLDAQGVNRRSANLASFEPYFSAKYAFVCGWVSRTGQSATATSLKITFPSPNYWFPLLPTKAYAHSVGAVVYTRGFVKPAENCDLPGLNCQYIFGKVETHCIHHAFASTNRSERESHYLRGSEERLTRITFYSDPQKWNCDLELVPGTTSNGYVNLAILGRAGNSAILWSSLLGALLGLLLPPVTIAGSHRTMGDYFGGAITGAAIVFSIWASLAAFAAWRTTRFSGQPKRPSRYAILPAFALLHFAAVFGICQALLAWIASD